MVPTLQEDHRDDDRHDPSMPRSAPATRGPNAPQRLLNSAEPRRFAIRFDTPHWISVDGSARPRRIVILIMRDFSAFAIEAGGTGAGVVIRQHGGYRFYASNELFTPLDGKLFRSPREAERAADRLVLDRRKAPSTFGRHRR